MTEQEYWDCKEQFRETLEKMKDEFVKQLSFSEDTKSNRQWQLVDG